MGNSFVDRYRATRVGPVPDNSEPERFYECQQCGAQIDSRDLVQVIAHEGPHDIPPETPPN